MTHFMTIDPIIVFAL
jgi:hypothetical protein